MRALFEAEAKYLWSRLAHAAGDGDALGALWSPDGDPRVTRIVHGAAHAFARVTEKLEDDAPEIAHALVASALPEVLRPTPSATVVQFRDARQVGRRAIVHDVQSLASRSIDDVPCTFTTCWPVALAPLRLLRAQILARESRGQALVLRLETFADHPVSAAVPDSLRFFVDVPDPALALDVVRAVTAGAAAVRLRALDAQGHEVSARELPSSTLVRAWTALESPFRLATGSSDRFESGSALRNFFSFPELFAFFDLRGLGAAVRGLPDTVRVLDISLPLGGAVAGGAMEATFHLGCAPAVNVFPTLGVPLPVRGLGPCGALRPAGPSGREIFQILDVHIAPDRDPEAVVPVHFWESHLGSPYAESQLLLRLARRSAGVRRGTEVQAVLVRPNDSAAPPLGVLSSRLLATDGARTESLLKGDVGGSSDRIHVTNITRVTRAFPVALSERLPWRANAYARMPVTRLALASSLASYLDVHDVTGARRRVSKGTGPALAGVIRASSSAARRVVGDEVFHGDEVEMVLDDAAFGGAGATWLVGELLSRALSERADFLRYTRTRLLSQSGEPRADYGVRQGSRLPPPFG